MNTLPLWLLGYNGCFVLEPSCTLDKSKWHGAMTFDTLIPITGHARVQKRILRDVGFINLLNGPAAV